MPHEGLCHECTDEKDATLRLHAEERADEWFGVQKRLTKMDENEVAELVAEETTLNPAEALMAICQLRKVMLCALMDGKSVQLGN